MRLAPSFAALLSLSIVALLPAIAQAHIEIVTHTTRYGKDVQKGAPCGMAGGSGPGDTIYTYAPGETVTIGWNEFINHPGHYRVSFDPDGDDDFVDPATADEVYSNEFVLLDDIADLPDVHDYEVQVQLPDVECEVCTIQVIQVMTDKAPYGDGNDIYYHCIDVRLEAASGTGDTGSTDGGTGDTGSTDGGSTDGGSTDTGSTDGDSTDGDSTDGTGDDAGADGSSDEAGCSCASDRPAGGAAALTLIGLLAWRRRR